MKTTIGDRELEKRIEAIMARLCPDKVPSHGDNVAEALNNLCDAVEKLIATADRELVRIDQEIKFSKACNAVEGSELR